MDDVRDFLSMDYEEPVTYGGMRYRCAEAAYQAQRLSSDADRRMFRLLFKLGDNRNADPDLCFYRRKFERETAE